MLQKLKPVVRLGVFFFLWLGAVISNLFQNKAGGVGSGYRFAV